MCESAGGTPNVAMVAVKSLNVDKKGIVAGYYKDSNPQLVLLFGRDGKDSHIDGTITAATKGNKPYREDGVGLIKEGIGTTYITAEQSAGSEQSVVIPLFTEPCNPVAMP